MKLIFTEKLNAVDQRIIVELINSLGDEVRFPDQEANISINRVYPIQQVDDKNSKQVIHLQRIKNGSGDHYLFSIQYGNDFSCSNIYLTRCEQNPRINELAMEYLHKNYDHTGIAADIVAAFIAGYNERGAVRKAAITDNKLNVIVGRGDSLKPVRLS
jgi:hypothetical protein